jgi:hypothetical protein
MRERPNDQQLSRLALLCSGQEWETVCSVPDNSDLPGVETSMIRELDRCVTGHCNDQVGPRVRSRHLPTIKPELKA